MKNRKRFRFSIRTLLIMTAIVAALLYWFLAEFEFMTIESRGTWNSPDGVYSVVIESKKYQSITRKFYKVETRVYDNSVRSLASTYFHYLGTPQFIITKPVDFGELGPAAFDWNQATKELTYQVTESERVLIPIGGGRPAEAKVIR